MGQDIVTNIISDIIYSFIAFLFLGAIFLIFNRSRLLKFFGIKKFKKVIIYTSNLFIPTFSAEGIDGNKYSFSGNAVPELEAESTNLLKGLFNFFLPSNIGSSEALQKILISDVKVETHPSPRIIEFLEEDASIITIGFPVYNRISKYVEENLPVTARLKYVKNEISILHDFGGTANTFQNHPETTTSSSAYSYSMISPSGIRLPSSVTTENKIPAIVLHDGFQYTDTSIGFIQRIIDTETQSYFFYLAGLSENATAGCVYFLRSKWHKLKKSFGFNTSFLILLKVSTINYKQSRIIYNL